MGKYYLRYMIFWLPAALVSLFFNNSAVLATAWSQAQVFKNISIWAQWLCAFFMLFGWGVTTATASYRFPRATMSFVLSCTGINLLIITMLYATHYGSPIYNFLRNYAGILSYIPLSIIKKALEDFNIQQEVVVTLMLFACCIIGYIAGLVRRRVSPNPYRPRYRSSAR